VTAAALALSSLRCQETIGDALMCVAGCPVVTDPVDSATRMARMALDMIQAVERFRPSLEGVVVRIRVGLHSGPVVAGVVGKRM
jgi:class 3 adenylate cyclase